MKHTARAVFISLLLALSCMFTACSGISVKEYRELKAEEIQNYADAKGKSNFSAKDWNAIHELVLSGQQSIKKAGNRPKIDQIVLEVKAAVDEVKVQAYNTGHDGAYFITDESYEAYVRGCAAQVGADEQWVLDVLNGGDGGNWYYLVRRKNFFRCAIADRQITVSKIADTVYEISQDGDTYQGSSATQSITFWFEDDILYLRDNAETLEYRNDDSYKRVDAEATALAAPQDMTVYSGETGRMYIEFWWDYKRSYGTVGAMVEIKKPGAQDYRVEKIERIYMNQLVVDFAESQFEPGVNWVRISHIGGPTIPYSTNDKSITVTKNSEYKLFRVTVAKNGKVKVKDMSL